ncbi:MAG: DUF1569 domain-containing protein [Gemmataceae bacterium]
MAIKTHLVSDRRSVHYDTFDDLRCDVESLVGGKVRTVGNWSLAQILDHLTKIMVGSLDGYKSVFPWPMRVVARLLFKKRFLTKGLPPGFKIPSSATDVQPEDKPIEETLVEFRDVIRRLEQETPQALHPAFGKLTLDEWKQLHLRHAELHLSFVIPVGNPE